MNGPEHYREAERWLAHAKNTYLDNTGEAGPREDYATDAEWVDAMQEGAENHERKLREMAVFAVLAQAHAGLAHTAAAALDSPKHGSPQHMAWVRAFHGMDQQNAPEGDAR